MGINNLNYAQLHKSMEWEADRGATSGTIDVFMTERMLNLLPQCYRGEKEKLWLLRIILFSIGAIQLILEKSHQLYTTSFYYPSIMSRFVSNIFLGLIRANVNSKAYQWFNFDGSSLNWLLTNTMYDLVVASDLLYSSHDKIDFKGTYDYEQDFKSLKLFDSLDEYESFIKILLQMFFTPESEWEKRFKSPVFDKYFLESILIAEFQKSQLYPFFEKYRRMTNVNRRDILN